MRSLVTLLAAAALVATSSGKPAVVADAPTPAPSLIPRTEARPKLPEPIAIYPIVFEGRLVATLVAFPLPHGDWKCAIAPSDGIDPLTARLAAGAIIDTDKYCAAWSRLRVLNGGN